MAQVGLNKLYYAPVTADTEAAITYGTPVRISGAINADIKPGAQSGTLFADDGPREVDTVLGEIDVTLELADLPLATAAALLGATLDATTGELIHKSTDVAPYVALLFQSAKADNTIRYVKLLKGKFSANEEVYKTKDNSITFQTPKLTGKFVARIHDSAWIRKIDSDSTATGATAAIAAWYTNVEYTAS